MDAYSKCPTHSAIFTTCMKIGLEMKEALGAILHYAQRNELVHANLLQFIKAGNWVDLAKTLHNDLCDVPKITDLCEDNCSSLLQLVLQTLINEWYTVDDINEDNVNGWIAKPSLVKLRKGLLEVGGDKKKQELNRKMVKDMVQAMKKTQREKQVEKELRELILAGGLMTTEDGKTKKRVSQSQLGKEREIANRMTKSWESLMKIANNLRRMRDKHLEDFQVLAGGPELVLDPTMEDEE